VVGDLGLQAIPATYHTFGVDGSVGLRQAVDNPGNTALPELDNRLAVLDALANDSSDHLPVLQEYQVVTPPPVPPGPGTAVETAALSPGAFPPHAAPVPPPQGTVGSTDLARFLALDHVSVGETSSAERLTAGRHLAEGDGVLPGVGERGPDQGVEPGREPTGKAVERTARNLGRLVVPGGAAGFWEPLLEIGAIRVADAVDR
jgi:hypothetical protein